MLDEIKIISARTVNKIHLAEMKVISINQEIFRIESKITEIEKIIAAAKVHLGSLSMQGGLSLKDILEIKARQATVVRKIAESELEKKECINNRQQAQMTLKLAQEENVILRHKDEKLKLQISLLEKKKTQRLLNELDEDNEEQMNWS